MISRQKAILLMPPVEGKTTIINEFGLTKDIISVATKHYESNYLQTKPIAKYFKGATITETCKNIWEWTRKNISYKIDVAGTQQIKSPSSVVNSGFADCKGLSIFILSVLQNLGIKANFRYACYRGKEVTHVYVVAYDEQGRTISVDACIACFNVEKPNIYYKDVMTQISTISGIGNAVCGCGCGKKKHKKHKKHLDNAVSGISGYDDLISGLYDNDVRDVFVGAISVYEDNHVGTTKERYTMPFYLKDDYVAVHGTFIGSIHEIGFLRKAFKKIGGAIKKGAQLYAKGWKTVGKAIKKHAGKALTVGLNFVPGGGVINKIRENVRTGQKFWKGLAKAGLMDAVTSFVPGGKFAKAGAMLLKAKNVLKGAKGILKGAKGLSFVNKVKNVVQKGKQAFETIQNVREQFADVQEQMPDYAGEPETTGENYQLQEEQPQEEQDFRENVEESMQNIRQQAQDNGFDNEELQTQWRQSYSDNLQEQAEEPQF
jgi:hypothetical protein